MSSFILHTGTFRDNIFVFNYNIFKFNAILSANIIVGIKKERAYDKTVIKMKKLASNKIIIQIRTRANSKVIIKLSK